ncbi:Cytochrome P450 monooxygenase pyr3 [Lasiodiplodia theobromae]|uniref:Cytochrome P450 monooxygenase pyr3 n=1 Tax=Lasiodiplodia theobromae TaxID=45133 RepID=A0A5N5D392_9PEZI|nr:Cytochrome P450 monooxygenase pyr3 [Lasiodiplodia theobromae]
METTGSTTFNTASYIITAVLTACMLFYAYWLTKHNELYDGIQVVRPTKDGHSPREAKKAYGGSALSILADGKRTAQGAFQVYTEAGVMIILPSKYFTEIKSDARFGTDEASKKTFLAEIPGFDGFHALLNHNMLQDMIRTKLTQSLGTMTSEIVEETALAAESILGFPSEWTEVRPIEPIYRLVARVSSRVFAGTRLCRDSAWLEIAVSYTVLAFDAARALRFWPERIRPLVHWFVPECCRLRKAVQIARSVLGPEIGNMKQQWEQAKEIQSGKRTSKNTISMMLDVAKGRPVDLIEAQLGLTAAAMHTTTDMTVEVLYQLCTHPEFFEPMREEIERVLRESGGSLTKKTALYELKFMDSFLKETQRLKPTSLTSAQRVPSEDVTLSDGTFLPKGCHVAIFNDGCWDPQFFENPERFDPYRFLNMRKVPGRENSSQFVTTTPEHLGFGHGIHATK